jgi:hypothetical protein
MERHAVGIRMEPAAAIVRPYGGKPAGRRGAGGCGDRRERRGWCERSSGVSALEFLITRVGVVGLGHMGQAFAVNLVEDGHQVLVYDRDPKRRAAPALRQSSPISRPATWR